MLLHVRDGVAKNLARPKRSASAKPLTADIPYRVAQLKCIKATGNARYIAKLSGTRQTTIPETFSYASAAVIAVAIVIVVVAVILKRLLRI